MVTINELYDLDHTLAKEYLQRFTYPWEALKGIHDFILELGPTLKDYQEIQPQVWVHPDAVFRGPLYYWSTYRSPAWCFYSRQCVGWGGLRSRQQRGVKKCYLI